LTENPFTDYNTSTNFEWEVAAMSNLRLDPVRGLPCIDSGSPAILDLDGSPSDMGVYGGLTPFIDSGAPHFPFVSGLTVPGYHCWRPIAHFEHWYHWAGVLNHGTVRNLK
jgi:hypothetical protein